MTHQPNKHTNTDTFLVHCGREKDPLFPSVNPPIYRTSTVLFPNMEQFVQADKGNTPIDPAYGRHGTPTVRLLEQAIADMEQADGAIATSSGVAALIIAMTSTLKAGDHILISDSVYGPTRAYADNELKQFGVQTTYYAPDISPEDFKALLQPSSRAVFFEAPGSLTFEMQNIPALAEIAHAHGMVTMADNTWGTPYYFRPFDHGIDISIHSATKYISGHSDLLMGIITAKQPLFATLLATARRMGACTNPEDAYLALRGIRTLGLRMAAHQQSTLAITQWLSAHPAVAQVHYPALPSNNGHSLWKQMMHGACGLFAMELHHNDYAATERFVNALEYFGIGYSWGGYESLVMPYCPYDMRTATKARFAKGAYWIRLHIGLEACEDLKRDIAQALEKAAG